MEQYIKKSALVAEIERIKSILGNPFCLNDIAKASWVARKEICEDLLFFINSTEVKEVDLEKELDSMITPELKFHKALPSLFDIAKHFFELGLKAQKEEPVSEDLEDFAKRQADVFAEREYEVTYDKAYLFKGYYWGCKAGAEWQFERVSEALLSEVLPCFMHGGEADEVVAKLDEVLNQKK